MANPEMTELLTVRLPPKLFSRLRTVADQDNRPMSYMARVFIERGVDDKLNHKKKEK
jgi:predicted DNA-binding protein